MNKTGYGLQGTSALPMLRLTPVRLGLRSGEGARCPETPREQTWIPAAGAGAKSLDRNICYTDCSLSSSEVGSVRCRQSGRFGIIRLHAGLGAPSAESRCHRTALPGLFGTLLDSCIYLLRVLRCLFGAHLASCQCACSRILNLIG